MSIALRPHQTRGMALIREAFGQKLRRVLFVAPTAFGKTVTFSAISAAAAGIGNRIIIIAHRQELIEQISRTLMGFGVDHGIISPQYTPAYRKPVQVASVGTLRARLAKGKIPEEYAKFTLVVIDETHHLLATNTFGQVYELLGSPRLLGVTATPQRGDGKGLGEEAGGLFQTLIEVIDVKGLIEEGYLSDFVVYAPPPAEQIDLSDVKTSMGDFEKKALADKVDKPRVIGSAVAEYAKICPGAPAVVFCVSLDHCRHVAAEFQAAGFNFQVIDGSMPDTQRKALIDGLGNDIQGLVSCDVISEGTDIPAITCAIFLRPTKSLGLFIQQAGRALRTIYAPGYDLSTREGRLAAIAASAKPRAILLDHAGLTYTHGLIDDPREWSLAGKKKRKGQKKESEPRLRFSQCPTCFTVHELAPVCPTCQHVYEAVTRRVETEDGELRDITQEIRARRQEAMRAQGSAKDVEEMMTTLGYSRGRAEKVLAARFEKTELIDSLTTDLRAWWDQTGQTPTETFGIAVRDVRTLKPKALRELRARVDDHLAVWRKVAPAPAEQAIIDF